MPRFPLITGTSEGSTIVQLSGEIDLLTAPRIIQCLDAVTATPDPRVIVDLRPVTFMDCRGLAVLVRTRHRVEERAGRLALVITNDRILRIMDKTGLLDSFAVFPALGPAKAEVADTPHDPVASA